MINRGDIYFVDLDPVVGREQQGRRPVVVVSINDINHRPLVVTVIPGTHGENIFQDRPTQVRVPATDSGLPKETVFLCLQIRALDHTRFPATPTSQLPPKWMVEIEKSIRHCLGV